ncbi:hypothetical protein [Streptomyces sp. CC228A]|uniref:hypothetical protein n=1 Tax=Streptomyces sp. CC228A TaxID=2898186 RepID=UPI001F1B23F2|nr:hypothetical protein [Streptomyces sp. CC228A]
MTAQPDHHAVPPFGFRPPMGTLAELRSALSTWGFPGDRERFEKELDALDLDDLTQVRELAQAYRHRVLLRHDPAGMAALARTTDDVEAELRHKLKQPGAR